MHRGSSLILLLFILTFITQVSQQLGLTSMKNVILEIAETTSQSFQFLPLDTVEKANIHTGKYNNKNNTKVL